MTSKQLTPESYVMPLGKYKGMFLKDVVNIRIIDKSGQEKKEGIRYLRWLCNQDWFKHKSIVEQVISQYIE